MKRVPFFLCAFFWAASVSAKEYRIEKDYSIIEFRIRHLVSMTEGHFSEFDGALHYDPSSPESAVLKVLIRTKSIDTHNKQRDKHLRNKDFFNVSQYPTATYESQRVTTLGKDHLKVDGVLTLLGVSRPVSLDVHVRGTTTDDYGRHRAGFSAETHISRKDFGMTWNETLDSGGLLLGDEVEIEIEIDAVER